MQPTATDLEQTPIEPREHRASLEDDLFWVELLTPLLHLAERRIDREVADLCSRPHDHPRFGRVAYDRRTILSRLRWLRGVRPAELYARCREVHGSS